MPGKAIYLIIMLFFPLFATAQNCIDQLVDELSTTGNADFTSIVQRNPKTKAVEKVVKKLETNSINSKKFINAFKKEAKLNKTTTTTRSNGEITTIITTSNKKTNRIYMIKYDEDSYYPEVNITIIIKVK